MSRWETQDALARLASGDPEAVAQFAKSRSSEGEPARLPRPTADLVRVAALIALDAPPAVYARQVTLAIEAGANSEDILAVLHAVAPHVGSAKVIAAAPELMLALGMTLPNGDEFG